MLNPDAKEYTKQFVLPDISVFYDKKYLLVPFNVIKKKPSGSRKWFKKIKNLT